MQSSQHAMKRIRVHEGEYDALEGARRFNRSPHHGAGPAKRAYARRFRRVGKQETVARACEAR